MKNLLGILLGLALNALFFFVGVFASAAFGRTFFGAWTAVTVTIYLDAAGASGLGKLKEASLPAFILMAPIVGAAFALLTYPFGWSPWVAAAISPSLAILSAIPRLIRGPDSRLY